MSSFRLAEFNKITQLRENRILPPSPQSPFGDFPRDFAIRGSPNFLLNSRKNCESYIYHEVDDIGEIASPGSSVLRLKGSHIGKLPKRIPGTVEKKPKISKLMVMSDYSTDSNDISRRISLAKTDSWGKGPKYAGAYDYQRIPPTLFRKYYERGDLPASIQFTSNSRVLSWKVPIEKLDYHYYLPIFCDGLRELEEPYKFIASQGALELLNKGGDNILPTIPQLIIPLKTALNTRHPDIMSNVLKFLQKLVVSGDLIGEALVPYYRQLLPIFNLYKDKHKNLGDKFDYAQCKGGCLSDLVSQTLQLLEMYGGEDAYINIKYVVASYESANPN